MPRLEHTRRLSGSFRWFRAVAFAAVTFLAVRALGFYPTAIGPLIALSAGALALFAPGIGVLLFVVATGIPLMAADMVTGVVYLLLGFGTIQYLSEDRGRAFLVVGLAFVATLARAEWAVAALAGYVLGASEGAVIAFLACLVIQGAGLIFGLESIGSLATGGGKAVVDLSALAKTEAPLAFGWFMPSLSRVASAPILAAVMSVKHLPLFAAQPFLMAITAAVAGLLRRPAGDPKRPLLALAGAAAGVIVGTGALAGLGLAFAGPVGPGAIAVSAGISLVVALAYVALGEYVFTPIRVKTAQTSSLSTDDADVDELLRMISSAEEELASKHTVQKTVLITDMKSFSKMTEELGSTETAKLVQRHRDLLLPIVDKHGGHGKSTGGDGLLAAFDSPGDALAAACEMQQALSAYNASRSGVDEISVRAGIATGEVVLDRGGKPFLGDALNKAARVMSLADGGQVFTTRQDAEASGTALFGSVSHGEFRLKNIAVPVEVVELLWSAGQEARPPADQAPGAAGA